MKTIDGKIVDLGYFVDSVLYNDNSEHVIIGEIVDRTFDESVAVGETKNQLDLSCYSSMAAIREKYPKATISLIVDDYGGEIVFTLTRLRIWAQTLKYAMFAKANLVIDKLERWCKNENN